MDNALPAWGSCLLALLGVGTVRLGLTGFSPRGLSVGLGVRWKGVAAKVLGAVLVALGLAMTVPLAWLVVGALVHGEPGVVPGPDPPASRAPG